MCVCVVVVAVQEKYHKQCQVWAGHHVLLSEGLDQGSTHITQYYNINHNRSLSLRWVGQRNRDITEMWFYCSLWSLQWLAHQLVRIIALTQCASMWFPSFQSICHQVRHEFFSHWGSSALPVWHEQPSVISSSDCNFQCVLPCCFHCSFISPFILT